MPDFDPFDMDFDGDVDGIDFLGFDYLMRYMLKRDESDHECDESEADDSCPDNEFEVY